MKLVTYNIHYGFGRDGTNDIDRIAAAVDGADVIAFQEVDRFWPRSGMVDQLAMLAKRLPDHWVAFGPNIDVHSPAGFPGETAPARRQFGNAIFSRYPIASQFHLPLPRGHEDEQTMQRGALRATITTPRFGAVHIYSTHLDYLSPDTRRLQLRHLAAQHDEVTSRGGSWVGTHAVDHGWVVGDEPPTTRHTVVLGDLNIAAGSAEYSSALQTIELVDAWGEGRVDAGGATKDGERIDHCWVSPSVAPAVVAAWVDADAAGSDHQPAWFEIDF